MNLFSKTGHETAYMNWWLDRQKARKDATLRFDGYGVDVTVKKTVFSPDPGETWSSALLLKHLPDLAGKKVLDMGCGCGLLGLFASTQGASSVVLADANEEAVANSRENLLHKASVVRSDLFEHIDETFDVIVANLPIIDIAWPRIEEGTHNLHARFFKAMPAHLSARGLCFLSFASFGEIGDFERLIESQPFAYTVVEERKFDVNWYLLELSMKNGTQA
ncbi:MAG: methyltransferase [Alphaproteobacteria bacterium]|nr:methyltransferase [Alphaproteobacteria bacterium]